MALDVGGTRLKGGVYGTGGDELYTHAWITHRRGGPEAVVVAVLDVLDELRQHPAARAAESCGLAAPGIVDKVRGYALWSENLGWRDVPLRRLAEERTGLPVALGHDVRAGGLAEARLGAARGVDNALFVPIGTGIGAAIIADGHVVDGGGMAGELGHVDVGHDERCACGSRGCLEAIASASGIARRYALRSGSAVDGAAEVARRARSGDAVAIEVWDEAVDALAAALTTACALLAPQVIVLGGGLSQAGDQLVVPLEERLRARLTFHRRPRVVTAVLGDRAGCLGASLLARELLLDDGGARR
ncbi:ROK family protein [Phytoactinopolyspora alkaliphila]|uniref:ROK family protein n=1 Tax=Phytoactinopolyspora alkaliphila TaxID=1783498 RepID=A0A6N9YKV6_9ACTN|nr:ROK family protein [Phytoactinopolyspora alkaliphila]